MKGNKVGISPAAQLIKLQIAANTFTDIALYNILGRRISGSDFPACDQLLFDLMDVSFSSVLFRFYAHQFPKNIHELKGFTSDCLGIFHFDRVLSPVPHIIAENELYLDLIVSAANYWEQEKSKEMEDIFGKQTKFSDLFWLRCEGKNNDLLKYAANEIRINTSC